MAVYSKKFGYIFFANPQTASKAIAKTLQKELGGKNLHQKIPQAERKGYSKLHHMTYDDVLEYGLLERPELDRLFKITGIRNPWDLLASRYVKQKHRFVEEADRYKWINRENKERARSNVDAAVEETFPDWLERIFGQRRFAKGVSDFLDHADAVIRFEALQEDFDAALAALGIAKRIEIYKENVTTQRAAGQGSQKKPYTEFYDDRSRSLIARLYEPVITRFKYRFGDEPFDSIEKLPIRKRTAEEVAATKAEKRIAIAKLSPEARARKERQKAVRLDGEARRSGHQELDKAK